MSVSEVPRNVGILGFNLFGFTATMAGYAGFAYLFLHRSEDRINTSPGEFPDDEGMLLLVLLVAGFISLLLAILAGIRFGRLIREARDSSTALEVILGFVATAFVVWATVTVLRAENTGYVLILIVLACLFTVVTVLAGRP